MLLTIRKAKVIDLKKTLEWANDKEVIKNSLNRNHKVKLIEHFKWFNNYLKAKKNDSYSNYK